MNRPRHRRRRNQAWNRPRHRRRHRNPALPAALTHPFDYIQVGAAGAFGMVGTLVGGNYVVNSFFPSYAGGATGKFVYYGARAGVAVGLHVVASRFLKLSPRLVGALNIGSGIAIVASLLFDMLGYSFRLGVGDTAQTPQQFLSALRLPGMAGAGQYFDTGLSGNVDTFGMEGMDAYVRSGARPRLRGTGGYMAGDVGRMMTASRSGGATESHGNLYGI